MIWLALQNNGRTGVRVFNAGRFHIYDLSWLFFDRQHIFRFKLLAIVRVTNANVSSRILMLHIWNVQSAALLLHKSYKNQINIHFIAHRSQSLTLKLYGKLRPPSRAHVTGAPLTEVDVQSTTIESPCRSTEWAGSNFKIGNRSAATCRQQGAGRNKIKWNRSISNRSTSSHRCFVKLCSYLAINGFTKIETKPNKRSIGSHQKQKENIMIRTEESFSINKQIWNI